MSEIPKLRHSFQPGKLSLCLLNGSDDSNMIGTIMLLLRREGFFNLWEGVVMVLWRVRGACGPFWQLLTTGKK